VSRFAVITKVLFRDYLVMEKTSPPERPCVYTDLHGVTYQKISTCN